MAELSVAVSPEPTVVTVGAGQVIGISSQVSVVGGGPAIPGAQLEYVITVDIPEQYGGLGLHKVSVIPQQYPEMHISVEGPTDNVGAEDYNLKLSEKRAKSVYDFLVHEGVPADHLDTKGYGMSQPVAANETAEGRQKNRRVDLVIRGE